MNDTLEGRDHDGFAIGRTVAEGRVHAACSIGRPSDCACRLSSALEYDEESTEFIDLLSLRISGISNPLSDYYFGQVTLTDNS